MLKRLIVLFLLTAVILSTGFAQRSKYRTFENIKLEAGASVISYFLQDSLGIIWVGTNRGLYSYDGYSLQAHFAYNDPTNTQIHCGVLIDQVHLFLGADSGLLIYDTETDSYEEATVKFPTDIRTMARQGDTLWLGTLNGLYAYSLTHKELKLYDPEQYPGFPHKTVYSMALSADGQLYVGTYDGLCYYIPSEDRFQEIDLPRFPGKNNQFVNSLLLDESHQCLWVGMEGGLLKYNWPENSVTKVEGVQDNSVKSLCLDADGRLLAGTDNGLYLYAEEEPVQHVMHDSRNPNSLQNNIIWNIFSDRSQNIWLGTEAGISLFRNNRAMAFVPISEITGTGDGNQFYSIYRDSRGYFWFGGTNGIIRVERQGANWLNPIWYTTDSETFPLPHGRIRHILENSQGELWIATDASVLRYDYARKQFVQVNILDQTGEFNTNWAYNLLEDEQQNLWIATCLGGVFVMDEGRLSTQAQTPLVADYNFNTSDGLSGMFINQLVEDQEGNVWVLMYNNGIDIIDKETRQVRKFQLSPYIENGGPSFILSDDDGYIWVGFNEGVMRIQPATNEVEPLYFNTSATNEVLAMVQVEGQIWISTTDGFWFVDRSTLKTRYLNLSDRRFLSMYYDKPARQVYLGDVDGFAMTTPDVVSVDSENQPIVATALYVNNELYSQPSRSVRYTSELELNYLQNNIAVEISDFPYALQEKSKLVYRLEGFDYRWNQLGAKDNRISYSNLPHGDYRLLVTALDDSGNPSDHRYVLQISIRPPWYYSNWAKAVYLFIFIGLVGWTINFFRVKDRLRIERIEKKQIMEQSRMKMEFLTNLSHELKTPLSMIIAPISRLLPQIKGKDEKRSLKQVQQNAIKLNALIHQMLDFNRIDSSSNPLLIVSRIEMVSFARKLFQVFQAAENEQDFTFKFESNKEKIFLEVDQIKWESILSNLLSNAVKYSTGGGVITLAIHYSDEDSLLTIRVSDTGAGIPSQDIPYIFQRFFQSAKTAGKQEGTGIGLYLVKTYTELHGGKVSLISEENVGTTVTITLPIQELNPAENAFSASEQATGLATDTNAEKPLILVVDDNAEITGFIEGSLKPNYRCEIAHDGQTGLERCTELQPDLLISDVMMPGMSGLEMIERIRKNVPTSTLPIILLTAKDDKQTELESIQLNVDAFLSKPFEPEILLSRISQLLNRKQKLEAKIRIENIAEPKEIEAESQDEKFLAAITKIVEEHLADSDLNVAGLCKLSGISNKQIYRKIKQLTGMTPVEYIRSVRMKKAAMLLRQQKFSVAEVMYTVGFTNHSYFSKCFKAEFKQTPLQFKESQQNPA